MTTTKAGRPSLFTAELADEICTRLANGESLRSICSSDRDDFMPALGTVMRWVVENQAFREQYEAARQIQAETMADEIVSIADGKGLEGEQLVALSARDRLRVDSRKWVASKLLPKKYGDKITQEHTGTDGGPIRTQGTVDVTGLSAEQLAVLASIPVAGE